MRVSESLRERAVIPDGRCGLRTMQCWSRLASLRNGRRGGQLVKACAAAPWLWLREVRCGPCGAFSGLRSPTRREPPVFQSSGEAKPSLQQSRSSPMRSRLVQPSIPLAVRNPKSLNLASSSFFFLIHFLICCNGLFIFICCCCCYFGWFVGMILFELYFFFLWFGLLIILTIFLCQFFVGRGQK